MKIYLVGGAVRDKLLGISVKEKDWVVVGATTQDMLNLGYRQVGKEFPVFLHPKTNEEYALARMERKVSPGYKGFTFDTSPEVTLEEDLLRRDLTINAMAETIDGHLVDPYHGQTDLAAKMLRHVSPAFCEDPVRILRVGRFLARYAHLGFTIAEETRALMQTMVEAGEVNALVPERVWKELERALGEPHPEQFFHALANCQALAILFPELDINGKGIQALIQATKITTAPRIRLAALLHDQPDPKQYLPALNKRYRFPNAYYELAKLTACHYQTVFRAKELSIDELLALFAQLDVYRREERFDDFLIACTAIAMAHQQHFDPAWLQKLTHEVKNIAIQPLLEQGYTGIELAKQLNALRKQKIALWLDRNK